MTIEVRIFADLRYYIADSDKLTQGTKWEVVEGTTLGQVLSMLNPPRELQVFLLLNGSHCTDNETVLKEGDLVYVYPIIAGG